MTTPSSAAMPLDTEAGSDLSVKLPGGSDKRGLVGRSPGRLAWIRFRRDKAGIIAGTVVLVFILVAIFAPVISMLYGKNPSTTYGQNTPGLLNPYGLPLHANGDMSGTYWFGLEPGLGRDVFMQLVYGIRTSLAIAAVAMLLTMFIGIVVGIVAGYVGGKTDYFIGRIIDLLLCFPSTLFFIAFMPVVESIFASDTTNVPTALRVSSLISVLVVFGWAYQARLLRGLVLSLREREYIEAAKVTGASTWRIVFKELLPNLWSPILVQGTLLLPTLVTAEAGLSFLGVGIIEPTPDWGRMIATGSNYVFGDITYMIFPSVAMIIFVLAFNLLGDSVRDALDPRTKR